MAHVPKGKSVLYGVVDNKHKLFIKMQAVKQGVSDSRYLEACIELAMKTPPVLGRIETRGRRAKKNTEVKSGESLVELAEKIADEVISEMDDFEGDE